jgi:hypothetical protein
LPVDITVDRLVRNADLDWRVYELVGRFGGVFPALWEFCAPGATGDGLFKTEGGFDWWRKRLNLKAFDFWPKAEKGPKSPANPMAALKTTPVIGGTPRKPNGGLKNYPRSGGDEIEITGVVIPQRIGVKTPPVLSSAQSGDTPPNSGPAESLEIGPAFTVDDATGIHTPTTRRALAPQRSAGPVPGVRALRFKLLPRHRRTPHQLPLVLTALSDAETHRALSDLFPDQTVVLAESST